jgi:hypothetical protein
VLVYNRALTTAERQRAERYLAARWGITLAPQVSNADAQDWINRVYANGGQVSAATAASVNTLCDSLDASGVRPLIYRMGIFAGSNLNAALVPLYRGPSLGGTQYGGATDTNAGGLFVSGDYSEMGASGGLLGNGSSKYLDTGFNASAAGLAVSSFHMAVALPTYSHPASSNWIPLSIVNSAINDRYWLNVNSYAGNTSIESTVGLSSPNITYQVAATNGASIPGGLLTTSRTGVTALNLYQGATSRASSQTTVAGSVMPSTSMTVFVRSNGAGAFYGYWGQRLRGYSVGLGMNSDQVAAYNAAMTAFQTSLERSV